MSEWDMSDITYQTPPHLVWHAWFIHVTWPIPVCDMTLRMCDMTHSYAWHDSFPMCGIILRCVMYRDMAHSNVLCDMTYRASTSSSSAPLVCHDSFLSVWHDSFLFVTWLIPMRDMTHKASIRSCSATCRTCRVTHVGHRFAVALPHMCDMTHSYVWHDVFWCSESHITCLFPMCDLTPSDAWHASQGINLQQVGLGEEPRQVFVCCSVLQRVAGWIRLLQCCNAGWGASPSVCVSSIMCVMCVSSIMCVVCMYHLPSIIYHVNVVCPLLHTQ